MSWSRKQLPEWATGVTVYEEPTLDPELLAAFAEPSDTRHRRPPPRLRLRPGRRLSACVLSPGESRRATTRRRPGVDER